jgi:hypothetical protein
MKSTIRQSCFAALLVVFCALPGLAQGDNQQSQSSSAGVSLSPALKGLDASTAVLDQDVKQLSVRAHKVSQVLNISAKGLAVPSQVSSDLHKLASALKQLDKAAETAEAVPQARENAKKLRSSIGPVLKDVTAAKEKAHDIADKVEPVIITVAKASLNAERLSKGLALFDHDLLQHEPAAAQISQTCVNGAADGKKVCMKTKVDEKADQVDQLVVEMDRVIKPLVASYVPSMPALLRLDEFNASMKQFEELLHQIERLESKIEVMLSPLHELEKLLDKEFRVKFHVPLLGSHSVGVGMRTIIKGSNAVEKEIEHVLSKTAWKVAKEFGVGKLVKSLEKDAQKEMDSVLNKLHLNPVLSLTSLKNLGDMEAPVDKLIAALSKDFSIPAFDLKHPDFGLPGIAHGFDLHMIGTNLNWLAPNGFELQKLSLCKEVSYGCK